jgi:hypothetical protein
MEECVAMQAPRSVSRRIERGVGLIMAGWLAAALLFNPYLADLPWSYWLVITLVINGLGLVAQFVRLVLHLRREWRSNSSGDGQGSVGPKV